MNHDGGGPYWKLYHNSNISKLWKNSTFIYACIKFKYLFESGPCIWYKAEDNKFNLIHLQLAQTWSENGTVHWPARTTERAQRLTSARAEHEIGTTPRDVVGVRHCVRHSGRHIRPQSGRGAWAGQSPSLLCQCVSLNVGGGHRSWCASYCHTLSPPLYKEACLNPLLGCWCFHGGRFSQNRSRVGCRALVSHKRAAAPGAWTRITSRVCSRDQIRWQADIQWPDKFWGWRGGVGGVREEGVGGEMDPGQVELSSLLGWIRTFNLQSQVS